MSPSASNSLVLASSLPFHDALMGEDGTTSALLAASEPQDDGSWSTTLARIIGLCVVALLSTPVGAQDFYAGKTLTVIAGFPPGGGVDGEMRMLSKYLARYIPGQPTIVSRNMPGAGGIVLANHLYNAVAPDGLTLGMPGRSGFLLSNVVPQQGISYDLTRYSYVGSAGSAANALWLHRRTGVSSIAELRRTKTEIVIGALNARSENAIAPRVLASYEGWPLKVVTGYPGFNDVLIALERGEVDGLFSHEGSVANTRPDLIASGAVKPVVQTFDVVSRRALARRRGERSERARAARPCHRAEPYRAAAARSARHSAASGWKSCAHPTCG